MKITYQMEVGPAMTVDCVKVQFFADNIECEMADGTKELIPIESVISIELR